WFLRLIAMVVIVFVIALVSDYLSHRVQIGSVLVVKLQGQLVERGKLGLANVLRGEEQTPLNLVRHAIETAARDPRIAGLAIEDLDVEGIEFAQSQELAELIRNFKLSGKFTAAYVESAEQTDYVVAGAADEVSIMPEGELDFHGVEMRELFL